MAVPRGPSRRGNRAAADGRPRALPAGVAALVGAQPELLASLLDTASDAIFIQDAAGRFTYVNRAMATFFG